MTRKATTKPPVLDAAPGLRQRQRADGSWRVWWEPNAAQRAVGATVVEFDPAQPGHATRAAQRLADDWARVWRGEAPTQKKSGRSVDDLIQNYRQSLAFTKKPESTRATYGYDLTAIALKWGPQPVALFDKPTLAQWYEALHAAKGVHRSRSILRMMSILMEHAELRGWRAEGTNPCKGIRTETPMERERTASWAEFDALLAAARRLRARAVVVALYLAIMAGQRQYDILRVRPGDFYTVTVPHMTRPLWVWQLVQSKRKRALEVPIHAAAVSALRLQMMRAADGPGTLIWDEVTGKPFTPRRFFDVWEKVRADAATTLPSVASLQWRDLRRTFANLSRAGGSSDADTSDVLGNTAATNARLRRTYMAPQLATTLRAVEALQRPTEKPQPERKKA